MDNNIWEKEENFSFWKNLILVFSFFTLTPLVLLVSLFSLFSLTKYSSQNQGILPFKEYSGVRVFASLPIEAPVVNGYPVAEDARAEIIKQYLSFYNSPLEPYALKLVETADKYGLDFRLLTAIAQKESNLCKIIPLESYNCWGWGIHSKGSLGFESFDQAIETVSKGLKEEYIDKGYLTVEDIMKKYTPLSSGTWAEGVSYFMAEMQ